MTTVTKRVSDMINAIIEREGGYVNDPADRGGETKYGITVAVARANGYTGAMIDLPRDLAFSIYLDDYYVGPRFSWVAERSAALAEELMDTGVNMGVTWAAKFLQRSLNLFNDGGKMYPDIAADGYIGSQTMVALDGFIAARGAEGLRVLTSQCDDFQSVRYAELAESRPANERFSYGWKLNRTQICA